jgi:signal transduction histidine kinase
LADIAASGVQTRLPFEDEPPLQPREVTALDLRLDAQGTVISADAAHAHLLVGLRPFAADPDSAATCDALSLRAVRARLPVEAGRLAIDSGSALAGSWRVDAVPLFAPAGGHFLGYYARLRRPSAACAAPVAAANDDAPAGSDMLRQMLHELRTPINAIQGFAELIQQQLLGPTPHQYRSLAAGIASDAAHLLAGFEDIERLVALETGRLDSAAGEADLNALLERLLGQLDPLLTPREIKLRSELPGAPLPVALSPDELERTLWRLLLLIAGAAAPGERLTLSLKLSPGANPSRALLALPLPAALAMHDDEALMAPDVTAQAVSGGAAMLGGGFALRLAAAEIRAAGGTFARIGARLDIAFPLLTTTHQTLSHQDRPVGQAG